VVAVHVQIPDHLDLQEQAVAGETVQHVVEKRDARVNEVLSAPVQVDGERDVGFLRASSALCLSLLHGQSSLLILSRKFFSLNSALRPR
jgi:hypothetical protein